MQLHRSAAAILVSALGTVIVAACAGSSGGASTPPSGSVQVEIRYVVEGPAASGPHVAHAQVTDPTGKLVGSIVLASSGAVDVGAIALAPGSYSLFAWHESSTGPSGSPFHSQTCGAPILVPASAPFVVTVTAARIGACITETNLDLTPEPSVSSSAPSAVPSRPPSAVPSG